MEIYCPICDTNKYSKVGQKYSLGSKSILVSILKCTTCKHLFTFPIPTQSELNNLYKSQSDEVLGTGWVENYLIEESNPVTSKIVNLISLINPNSILEVGCGNGAFIREIRRMNFSAYGVEPGSWIEEDNIYSDLDALPNDLYFDCVVIQDVLEHVENPLDFLLQILKRTENSTEVIITVPAGDSAEANKFGVDWEMVRPFGHLHYFSNTSINIMASKLDLKVKKIQKFRRELRSKSVIRLIFLPLLWIRFKLLHKQGQNPYKLSNFTKYLCNAFSSGDQYFVILSK